MFQWVRALRQTTTYLGVIMIAVLWGGVVLLVNEENQRAYEDGLRKAGNLTRIFGEYISRVIEGTDSQLLLLRKVYDRDPEHFNFADWIDGTTASRDLTILFSVTGPDGIIKLTSLGPVRSRVDISTNDTFRVHINSASDELYIGRPSIGHLSGKASIQLTRRRTLPDGSFGGTVGASLDMLKLEKFYDSIDIGRDGVIAFVGFDGIIRARSGRNPVAKNFIGESVAQSQALEAYRNAPTGSYWSLSNASHRFEGVNRLMSYRVVDGLPLLAVVGLAESDVFRQALLTSHKYYQVGVLLTIIILICIAVATARQMKLIAAAAALEHTNRRFDAALENMTHGLSMFDAEQRLVICNRRYAEMYGHPPEQLKPGTPLRSILEARVARGGTPEDGAEYVTERLPKTGSPRSETFVNELQDGRVFEVNRQLMPGGGWVVVHQDITAQKRAEVQIAFMAQHDSLTGIANRMVLIDRMRGALAAHRTGGRAFSLFVMDLDGFKAINDSLGHPVGDALLRAVAERLRASVREADVVARLGGDEFAILAMAQGDQRAAAIATAIELIRLIVAPYTIDGNELDIGTSIGIALAPEHGADVDELLKNADLALYKAKAGGGNAYQLFEPVMMTAAFARRALQVDLRNALTQDDGQLELHYHPIIDIRTKAIASVEALIRWRHPLHGMIAPAEFISLAEDNGLIHPLGEWVLRKACTEAARWPSDIKVSVNLSPVQFRRGDPVNTLARILAESGLSPKRLELEITESVLMHGTAENIEILHQLRSLGIAIVLDDFGTGYSSLSYLRMFAFDKIKIDRSFVSELSSNGDCAAIVSAVAGLGSSLNIGTVAEGVETEDQLALVRAAGCAYAQGFLFGQPCLASELDFTHVSEQKPKSAAA